MFNWKILRPLMVAVTILSITTAACGPKPVPTEAPAATETPAPEEAVETPTPEEAAEEAPAAARPFEGKKVVVVTQTGRSIGGPVEDHAPEWEAMTGGEV